ncbi:MAG: Flp family type IVb pilin [Alphaproteobacteria bacterium]|nr:Flp family type IVb pilin [Alphaproteobacteria bacterium]
MDEARPAAGFRPGARRSAARRRNSRSLVKRFAVDTQGATAIEYSIIIALIAFLTVAALALIGPQVLQMLTDAGAAF